MVEFMPLTGTMLGGGPNMWDPLGIGTAVRVTVDC